MISFIVLARKLLGRKGTFLLRNIISSISYRLGLYEYADGTGRAEGISAMVCSYNEEDWIEPSLLSIKDLVDEYVVVDSSTDRTPQIVENIKEVYGLNVKLIRLPPGSLSDAKFTAITNASYKWILHWDPDFIAYDHMSKFVKELIESLDKKRHYLIYWKYLLFCGDLKHLCDRNYHIEHWLFTYSRKLSYKDLDIGSGKIMDVLIAPLRLYKPLFVDKVLGVHLAGVRKPERIAIKHLWIMYKKEFTELAKMGADFRELAVKYAEKLYGTRDLRAVGIKLIDEMTKKLPHYREEIHGPLPKVLKEYIERKVREDPDFKVIIGS